MLFGTLIPRFGRFFRNIRSIGTRRRRAPQIPPAASSSTCSIEVQEETSFTEDIELVQVSDSTSVSLMAETEKGPRYCQAVQQGEDENNEVALFADLKNRLPINKATIFKQVSASPVPLSFRLYNESITGYVAAPTAHTQNCFTIVGSEEESCVFVQDPTNRIHDTKGSNPLYMRVEGNKIVATTEPNKGSVFSIRPI